MSDEALLLLAIFFMIGVLILQVRKLRISLDSSMRRMYVKSALETLDEEEK